MKIAAGEVVTSSASVVKELIENSIDAHATSIRVEIKNGGRDSIIISDNGKGIPSGELKLAVEPHATSKIGQWDDILNLSTYGFRGEALASVASVSEMYLSSKTDDEDVGRKIYFRGSVPVEESTSVMNRGTEIEIRNLFFNVPARRKFLKSPQTESRYVLDTIEKFILSNPEVAFQFIRDGKVIYDIKPESVEKRISRILKVKDSGNLIKVDYTDSGFTVYGAVTSPQVNRPNLTGVTLFVNMRYVKDSVVYGAIKGFFAPLMSKGRYPLAVLFITVPTDTVDINVHPQKLEIKYSDGGAVFRVVKKALNNAFNNYALAINVGQLNTKEDTDYVNEKPAEQMGFKQNRETVASDCDSSVFTREAIYDERAKDFSLPIKKEKGFVSKEHKRMDTSEIIDSLKRESVVENSDDRPGSHIHSNKKERIFSDRRILGIVDRRYIVVEEMDGLTLIDFHAAHERVLFEKIKKKEKKLFIQKLLNPIVIETDKAAIEILRHKKQKFEELGFDYHIIEDESLEITGIPNLIDKKQVEEVFTEIIDELRLLELEKESKVLDHVYATIACHNAFRTGDFVNESEAEELIRQMDEYEVFSCPHGRPVRFSLSFSKLDSFFKRS